MPQDPTEKELTPLMLDFYKEGEKHLGLNFTWTYYRDHPTHLADFLYGWLQSPSFATNSKEVSSTIVIFSGDGISDKTILEQANRALEGYRKKKSWKRLFGAKPKEIKFQVLPYLLDADMDMVNGQLQMKFVYNPQKKTSEPTPSSSPKAPKVERIEDILGSEFQSFREDAEAFYDPQCYLDYLQEIFKLSQGEIKLQVQASMEGKTCTLLFGQGAREQSFQVEIPSDWIDASFFPKLNRLLLDFGYTKGFYAAEPTRDYDQTINVVYTDRATYELLHQNGFVIDYMEEL